jgi:hypothetical protein
MRHAAHADQLVLEWLNVVEVWSTATHPRVGQLAVHPEAGCVTTDDPAGLSGGESPAVALTGLDGAEDRAQLLRAGFQYHVAKPVDARRHGGRGDAGCQGMTPANRPQ